MTIKVKTAIWNEFFQNCIFILKNQDADKSSQLEIEIEVEDSYDGLKLNFPIKKKDFHELVNYLKKDSVRKS